MSFCGLHCCFFLFPIVIKESDNWKEGIKTVLLFSLSKIFIYGLIGSLASYFGIYCQGIIQKRIFSLVSGFILIFIGSRFLFSPKRYLKIFKSSTPLVLGIIEGITPCAPLLGLIFYIAYLSKGIFWGFNAGLLFALGSLIFPVLLICGLIPSLLQSFFFSFKAKILFKWLGFAIFLFWGVNLIFQKF